MRFESCVVRAVLTICYLICISGLAGCTLRVDTFSSFFHHQRSGFGAFGQQQQQQPAANPMFGGASTPSTGATFGTSINPQMSRTGHSGTMQTGGFGGGGTSAFGAPKPAFGGFGTSTGTTNAFGGGTTSAFGQPAGGSTSAFGQPSGTNAFGGTSGTGLFGQKPAAPTVFGAPSQQGKLSRITDDRVILSWLRCRRYKCICPTCYYRFSQSTFSGYPGEGNSGE